MASTPMVMVFMSPIIEPETNLHNSSSIFMIGIKFQLVLLLFFRIAFFSQEDTEQEESIGRFSDLELKIHAGAECKRTSRIK